MKLEIITGEAGSLKGEHLYSRALKEAFKGNDVIVLHHKGNSEEIKSVLKRMLNLTHGTEPCEGEFIVIEPGLGRSELKSKILETLDSRTDKGVVAVFDDFMKFLARDIEVVELLINYGLDVILSQEVNLYSTPIGFYVESSGFLNSLADKGKLIYREVNEDVLIKRFSLPEDFKINKNVTEFEINQ